MINNIFAKRETKRRESDIDEDGHSRKVVKQNWLSCKHEPIGMIDNPY